MARREEMDTYGNRTYGTAAPGGARSRGGFGTGPFTGGRASGGFGAPIQPPGGGRSRDTFANQQDVTPSGGPQSVSPYTSPQDITNALGGNPPATPTPRFAPTSAQVAENPGQFAGTSFDPNRSIQYTYDPGGANSLPQGSENVNGVGMYTGANAPLDTTRFTPVTQNYQTLFDQYAPQGQSYLGWTTGIDRALMNQNPNRSGIAFEDVVSFLRSPQGASFLR